MYVSIATLINYDLPIADTGGKGFFEVLQPYSLENMKDQDFRPNISRLTNIFSSMVGEI